MRVAILMIGIAFTVAIGYFTARDLATHGATLPGVAAAFIVIVFMVALVGALTHPPRG